MATFDHDKAAALAFSRGLDPISADLMGHVAMCESSGDPTASNVNSNGTTDTGLWQINSVHQKAHPTWTVGWLKVPENNADAMSVLFRESKGPGPWSSSKSCWQSKFEASDPVHKFTDSLSAGTDALTGAASAAGVNPLDAIASLSDTFAGFFEWISDPTTWKRMAFILAGGAVAVVGVMVIARGTDTGQAVESAVTTVATKGAVSKPPAQPKAGTTDAPQTSP